MLTFFLAKSPEAPAMTMAVLVVSACWPLPDDALRISPVFSEEGTAAMDAFSQSTRSSSGLGQSVGTSRQPCSGGDLAITSRTCWEKSLPGLSITKQPFLYRSH